MGVWLEHRLSILASFGLIFSERGGWNLGVATKIVDVTPQKWAWSKIFVSTLHTLILCPRLSSYELGNCVMIDESSQ